jgi:DNA-binding winged helix-turn-helix (wHTH) protein/tetratricopeptide (TPR) repeat protein
VTVAPGTSRTLRFGVFEFDPATGELRKQGMKLKLQGQPIEILALLLERPGEIVTREELQKKLWPSDTFVDFEHSLNAAIKRLRDALDDSAATPRYIETLARRGYRFVGPIPAGSEVRARGAHPWRFAILVAAAALAALTVLGGFIWRARRAPKLTDKDTIVLAAFTNTTGDPVFTDTLRQGLLVELTQSPFLNIVPENRVQATLGRMGHQPQEPLDDQLAREVCQRTQSKAFIAGSIATLGSQYVLGVKAVNCLTGEVLVQEQSQVTKKEDVLRTLSSQASLLRRNLGESIASIQKFDVPLQEATTSSLEALHSSSLAVRKLYQLDFPAAIALYHRAIELDPNFASAYDGLAVNYINSGQQELFEENIKKAYSLRQRATERERLEIEGMYYVNTGELEKSAQTFELRKDLFTQETAPYVALTVIYSMLGREEQVLQEAREAFRRSPTRLTRQNLVGNAIELDHVDEAQKVLSEVVGEQVGNEQFDFREFSYAIAFLHRDAAEMARIFNSAPKGSKLERSLSFAQSNTGAYFGHAGKAREFLRRAVESERHLNNNQLAGNELAFASLWEEHFGNSDKAHRDAVEGLSLGGERYSLAKAALAFARTGDLHQAASLADDLAWKYPVDILLTLRDLLLLRATVEMNRNNPLRTIELLETARPLELTNLEVVYTRGQAYLRLHRGSEAAAEFQKIIDHPGRAQNNPLGALAHLELARAGTIQGDTAKAKAAYEDFLTLWKDADPDIPILIAAKVEYAKLK